MPYYFYDISDGATQYADDVGTDVQDMAEVRDEALSFLLEFASGRPPETGKRTYTVIVRDEAAKPIFCADVVVTARWLDTPVT